MFEIKKQFRTQKGMIINIENKAIKVNTYDNSKMPFDDFTILVKNGYSFIFDFSKKIIEQKIKIDENRVCKICNKEKKLREDYHLSGLNNKGYRVICKNCVSIQKKLRKMKLKK